MQVLLQRHRVQQSLTRMARNESRWRNTNGEKLQLECETAGESEGVQVALVNEIMCLLLLSTHAQHGSTATKRS